ncbi:PLP-dependent aminotransferase family protein [Novosphingobium album (ex Liu et al. 2023)]|uniref:PLP-dependent aminotransferase family protein n=1 Tax=Novosphingobium album (ex Liu et al. 2023) TaxID=3031130 RepID=A0ABT5WLG6_9SPHN|nr:PLP-dependent aminotransferase family protein [Novosphingobium album (ex Liu et al. 2023)]MDE8650729.1 PLP-dependent aminotransferase family protein [Novosphingobium album (ex Liu et al. 2023)]
MVDAWLADISRNPGPKYRAIADALAAAVDRGALRHGDRLPPQRDLAARLDVDLTTVTRAYELARQRGLIEARGRAGSFVRAGSGGAVAAPAQFDATMNNPPVPPGGLLQEAMARACDDLARSGAIARLQYQRPGGEPGDRAAGGQVLAALGLDTSPEQVVVTAGGQNALHGVAQTILRPGDRVACGRFLYPGFRAVARRLGVTLVPLATMGAAALAEAHRAAPLRALYVVPGNDNPTTATIEAGERAALAAFAQGAGLCIIEDDAYGLLADAPLPPIARFAPDRTWYIASTSKIISPALRVGFVRAPGIAEALQLIGALQESGVMAPPLNAAMVSAWVASGLFGRLTAATRQEAAWRQQQVRVILPEGRYAAHPQGYHLWLPLPGESQPHDLAAALGQRGLSAVPSDRFAVTPGGEKALRISLGGVLDRDGLVQALRMLAGYVSAPMAPTELII